MPGKTAGSKTAASSPKGITLRNTESGPLIVSKDGEPIPSGATFTVSAERAKQLLAGETSVEKVAEPKSNKGGE